jgi:hypothetical protein
MRARMGKALVTGLVAAGTLMLAGEAAAATIELKNDGLTDGGTVFFQQGFVADEMAGATLGPVTETFSVSKVRLLFGPTGGVETLTLNIYEDTGAADVGALLYTGDIPITPSVDAITEIDLTADNVLMAGGGSIRVAFQFSHTDLPSIARDDDGTNNVGRNWIYMGGFWADSSNLGPNSVPGDWIIRADALTLGAGGSGTGGSGTGGSGTGGSGTGGGAMICQPGLSQLCVGPGACQGGQSCLASGLAWGPCECDSGQNPASSEAEGGCSLSGSGPSPSAALALGALGAGLGLARLRRRARR